MMSINRSTIALVTMMLMAAACVPASSPVLTPSPSQGSAAVSAVPPSPTAYFTPDAEQFTATAAPVRTETATPAPTAPPTALPSPSAVQTVKGDIWVNHDSLALFDDLPDAALAAAARQRLLFRHASIGANINDGLDCLMNNFTERRPAFCTPFFDARLDRSNWVFQFRGNPGWIEKVKDFVTETNAHSNDYDVFTFIFAYADAQDGTTYPEISDPQNFQSLYIEPMEALEAAHPDKVFIWWTIPMAREGHGNLTNANRMIREYAAANHKIMLDIADLESYTPEGERVPLTPEGYEVLSSAYTKEIRAGHLNEIARERMARALWILMAQVSGWQP